LEQAACERAPQAVRHEPAHEPTTDAYWLAMLDAGQSEPGSAEDWLAAFEAWGRAGRFAHEADFPVALAAYRDALSKAAADDDPPFYPPADFLPGEPEWWRLEEWRRPRWYDGVRTARRWLSEMLGRLREGIPLVTGAEFAELAEWFKRNDERLYRLALPSQLLDLNDGRLTSCGSLRHDIAKGPRARGAGKLAEDLRRLRARYGGQ
jgi:hypothetical protein